MDVNSTDEAIWWTSGLNIDADGAPNAYGPNGGLDYLANAGSPGNWYGIVTDKNGEPFVQGPNDPCPGMFISSTALQDKTKSSSDPKRYVDSTTVKYISIPKNAIKDFGLKTGDVALVHCEETGHACAAIVADVGPKNKYGEGSIALARALGLPDSAKKGGTSSGVTMVIFKGSSRGWPRKESDIAQQVQDLLNAAGGPDQFGIG